MEGEEDVVGLRLDDRLPGRDEFRSNDEREHASDEEGGQDAQEIHHTDPFMVEREGPGEESLGPRQIVVNGW